MIFKQKLIRRKIFLSKITSYTKKCVGAVFSIHRFSSFWTFWKPFDPIQNHRGVTFWIFNFWKNWDTLSYLILDFISICYQKTRVAQFCQKFKIQKVNPLKCWIGSNGFQKVQKLENLCMLKTAPTDFFVYEVILLKKIFDVYVFT